MGQELAHIDNRLWCTRALMVKHGFSPRGYYGDEKVDEVISEGLGKRLVGLSLNLGSGFANHYDNSVNLDVSFHSLELNPKKGVLYDLNTINSGDSLPFRDWSFDSASMVGLWPYLSDPEKLFYELQRVVRSKGIISIVNQDDLAVEELRLKGNRTDEIAEEALDYSRRVHVQKVPFSGRTIDFIDLELV